MVVRVFVMGAEILCNTIKISVIEAVPDSGVVRKKHFGNSGRRQWVLCSRKRQTK